MMNIVLVYERAGAVDNGTYAMARALASAIKSRGNRVEILSGDTPDPARYYEAFRDADLVHLLSPSRFCKKGEKYARQMRLPFVVGCYGPAAAAGRRAALKNYRRFYVRFDPIHCLDGEAAGRLAEYGYDCELAAVRLDGAGGAEALEALYKRAADHVHHHGYKQVWPKMPARALTPHPDRLNRILFYCNPLQVWWVQFFSNLAALVMLPYNKIMLGFKVEGRQHIRKFEGGGVSVSNHIHPIDGPMWKTACLFHKSWVVSLRHNFSIPMIGLWIRGFGTVALPEKPGEARMFNRALERRVAEGGIVHYYAEGMQLPYCKTLRPLHPGAFQLAVKTGKPVIPMVFCQRQKRGLHRLKHRPPLTLCVLPPEYPDMTLSTRAARNDLQARVEQVMREKLESGKVRYGLFSVLRGRRDKNEETGKLA